MSIHDRDPLDTTLIKALEEALRKVPLKTHLTPAYQAALLALAKEVELLRTSPAEFVLLYMRRLSAEERKVLLERFCAACGSETPCVCSALN